MTSRACAVAGAMKNAAAKIVTSGSATWRDDLRVVPLLISRIDNNIFMFSIRPARISLPSAVAIPSQTIEQIAAANDIVEVIGSYFPLKRAGANFKALCPFHQEKTASFHVSPQRQTFHCFGCGVGGSVFRFVMDF